MFTKKIKKVNDSLLTQIIYMITPEIEKFEQDKKEDLKQDSCFEKGDEKIAKPIKIFNPFFLVISCFTLGLFVIINNAFLSIMIYKGSKMLELEFINLSKLFGQMMAVGDKFQQLIYKILSLFGYQSKVPEVISRNPVIKGFSCLLCEFKNLETIF
jgi:hypothetical protein